MKRNPQTHRIYAMSGPHELKIHKGEEVQSKGGGISLAYKHALKTNFGVGLFLFQTQRPGWMEYPGRFLKTYRRKGEFSVEKLNLPHSSGSIWDLSLLTAPQGTAVIFCTACTPRNTLLNQRMSARRRSADRWSREACGFHPVRPPHYAPSLPQSRLPEH